MTLPASLELLERYVRRLERGQLAPAELVTHCAACGCLIRRPATACTSCAGPTLTEHDERGSTDGRDD